MIPKVIHQIWLSDLKEMPTAWHASPKSWQDHHPDWEYRLWRKSDVRDLISSQFPEHSKTWETLPYLVAQVDMARYLILLAHGGVYSDHDVLCNRRLDELLQHDVVLPLTQPFGVSNDFMMATPGSALFVDIVGNLESNLKVWNQFFVPPYLRVMCGVGSLYVSLCYWRSNKERIHLLGPEDYSSQTPEALVHHIEGNSWGAWDSALIRQAYAKRHALLGMGLGLVAFYFWRKR